MKSLKIFSLCFMMLLSFAFCGKKEKGKPVEVQNPETHFAATNLAFVEGFPAKIVQRMLKVNEMKRMMNEKLVMDGVQPFLVSSLNDRRWRPGTVLRVAFNGGDSELHKRIANAAQEWTMFGNIKMDFGYDPTTDSYRQWKESDQKYVADIRVGFDKAGYWSHVGQNCIDPDISFSGEASTNFGGFTSELPESYKGTVLHEFGHSLGFEHEHQTPMGTCENEFDWPKVYKYMWDEFKWSQEYTDYNLRELPYESAYPLTEFDPKSVMQYYLPWEVYINGKQSKCFIEERNVELSQKDRLGMAKAYSYDEKAILEYEMNRANKMNLVKQYKKMNRETNSKGR